MTVMDELAYVAVNSVHAEVYLLGLRVEVAAVLASLVIGLLEIGVMVGFSLRCVGFLKGETGSSGNKLLIVSGGLLEVKAAIKKP